MCTWEVWLVKDQMSDDFPMIWQKQQVFLSIENKVKLQVYAF